MEELIFIVFYTHDDNDIAAVMSVPDNDIAEVMISFWHRRGVSSQFPTTTKRNRTRHSWGAAGCNCAIQQYHWGRASVIIQLKTRGGFMIHLLKQVKSFLYLYEGLLLLPPLLLLCLHHFDPHVRIHLFFEQNKHYTGKLGKVKSLEKFTDLLLLLLLLLTGLLDLLLPRLAPPLYIFTSTLKRLEIANSK